MRPKIKLSAIGLASVLLLLGAGAIMLFLIDAERPESSAWPVSAEMLPEGVPFEFGGPCRLTSMVQGKMEWSLAAEGIRVYEPEKIAKVIEPKALIPVAEGGTVELSAARGFYQQSTGDMGVEEEVKLSFSKEGEPEWRLEGGSGWYDKSEDAFYLSGLSGVIWLREGGRVRVSAQTGRYDRASEEMTLLGKVVCRDEQGTSLETDSLRYQSRSSRALTEDPVRIKGPGFSLSGMGFSADLAKSQVAFTRGVKLILQRGMGGSF